MSLSCFDVGARISYALGSALGCAELRVVMSAPFGGKEKSEPGC
jgi:hypothetical protein